MRLLGVMALIGMLAATPRYRILILGDSLTEGLGVDSASAFPAVLQRKLDSSDVHAYEVINGGLSGSTTATALSRLRWYAKAKPDCVILALGSNDGLRGLPVAETRRNIEAAIRFAQQRGWIVILTGLKVPPNYGQEYARDFEKIFPDLARVHKIPFIEFLLAGVAGETAMNQADGIHPNEKGHQRIADNLFHFLGPRLKPAWHRDSVIQ